MVKSLRSLRLGGVQIRRHAAAEEELGAARVVHLDLDGTQRTVILAHVVHLGVPPAVAHRAVLVEPGTAMGIGAVNETAVAPPLAPGVDDNPGSALVGGLFAINAVAVEVELNAVVVAHDGQRVVHRGAPFVHIIFSRNASFVVGRCFGNRLPVAATGHADTGQTTGMERVVAVVVPEPVFHRLTSLLGLNAEGEVGRADHAVEHTGIPLVVALHPTEVGVSLFLITEELGVGLSAVNRSRGHTHVHHEVLLARVAAGEQPHEVGGVIIVGVLAVEPAVSVQFMREHVADTRSRATRTTVLVEHGREVRRFGIVHVVRPCRSHLGTFSGGSEQRSVRLQLVAVVAVLRAVHLLCPQPCGQQCSRKEKREYTMGHKRLEIKLKD